MTTENIRALIRSRLEQADEALGAAEILLERESLRTAVNRAYYAMFYAVLALLALRQQETSKHAGAISLFGREFVLGAKGAGEKQTKTLQKILEFIGIFWWIANTRRILFHHIGTQSG
jgi:uncharacterized protein (UPF0332 family)